jgi:hypothetical protein
MSELNDFLKVISEAKKSDPKHKLISEVKGNVKSDLSSLFAELGAVAADTKKEDPLVLVKEHIKSDLNNLFAELSSIKEEPKQEPIVEEVLVERIYTEPPKEPVPAATVHSKAEVDKYLTDKSFQQPNPDKVDPNIKAIQDKMKFLEQAIGRIAATGPGGGEVNLRWLDDVKRDTISDGRWLKYSEADKKFVFDEINPYEVVYNTTEVTTATYTVQDNDYYIGVNYAGPVTITLPASANSGRMLIIKDEDGDAETNPITVQGTVDNDAGGFIIQINNGAIQLIYRNGWRIV